MHGHLAESQTEADRQYRRLRWSNPDWALKFQLLEANALAWRGMNDDVLRLFAEAPPKSGTPDQVVERLAIEASALTNLHQISESAAKLVEADRVCAAIHVEHCGLIVRAQGMLLLEQGQMDGAQTFLLRALQLMRQAKDEVMASSTLLNLGYIASQQEHHEEARQFYENARQIAVALSAGDLEQRSLGSEGWEEYSLGNPEKALDLLSQANDRAAGLGDTGAVIDWLAVTALVDASAGRFDQAEQTDLKVIQLATKINKKQAITDASMDLAQVYIDMKRPEDALRYARQAWSMAQATGSRLDMLNSHLLSGKAFALRGDRASAEPLLREVAADADSQTSMKWDAEHTLGQLYEAQGDPAAAQQRYEAALALVEGARADLKQEVSQLTFLENAASIYDDYIHLLVTEGKTEEALEAADWSRARTLQQGLGGTAIASTSRPPKLQPAQVARRANATLLFYWLGEKQSYLWVTAGQAPVLIRLPGKSEIVPVAERYRRSLLALTDPLKTGNKDARALYDTLIAPASGLLRPDRAVVLFVDGALAQLNFETLVVGSASTAPHFWIEDATVLLAPSIRMFAAAGRHNAHHAADKSKLLLIGDSVSPTADFPPLPMASLEMGKVRKNFALSSEAIFQGARATPAAYLSIRPEQFSYIHFVAHATASRTDPLESAVILSRNKDTVADPLDAASEESYKLRAREILRHPISAELVTISSCNSSGARSIAGEGLVGLSWAFLHAGAHNVIGALWDVSDASTPELMDHLYTALGQGAPPATALRSAKLSLLHSSARFGRPFYWAPFQLYSGQ